MLNDKQIRVIEPVKNIISLKISINDRLNAPQFHLKLSIWIKDQTNSDLIMKNKF